MHDLLEEKLEMDTSNITIERTHCVGEKPDDKIQFSFYKDEINSLKNCKKLKETKISIFEDFSQDTMQIRKGKISYLQYRSVICKEGQTPA